jgi:hypothetical protein
VIRPKRDENLVFQLPDKQVGAIGLEPTDLTDVNRAL